MIRVLWANAIHEARRVYIEDENLVIKCVDGELILRFNSSEEADYALSSICFCGFFKPEMFNNKKFEVIKDSVARY